MSDSSSSLDPTIAVNICIEFEQAWQSDQKTDFQSYLEKVGEKHRLDCFEMLLEIEVERRGQFGQSIEPDSFRNLGDKYFEVAKDIIQRFREAGPTQKSRRPTAAPAISQTRYDRIGPYKLLQQIGEGGMGSVWMAEQEKPVRRRVALKIIKPDKAGKQLIARFDAERQALAMMDHQNIARVLDAGKAGNGSPYLVMELVQGVPITEYCDRSKLSLRDRLELFVPVCKAIQHAHQKGILHRDLKPANVLVCVQDGKPVPKVIDFGLAKSFQHQVKLTDKTMFTEFGQVLGTIQYMSPEQAVLDVTDVDTRSDIYSLGVMLYELLSGSTPVDQQTLKQHAILKVLEIIREHDPPRPSIRLSSSKQKLASISEQRHMHASKLEQILRNELDWIVMKALDKDRTRRYETASDFAEDIQRFLDGEAVQARPPSTVYRINKFIRKNWALVTMSTAIALLLVAGITGTSAFAYKANESANSEKAQRKLAETKTKQAYLAEQKAKDNAVAANAAREKAEATAARSNYFLGLARWNENPPRTGDAIAFLDSVPGKHRHFEWYLANRQFEGSYATLYGHTMGLHCVALSPDGQRIVSGSWDKTIKVWEVSTGKELMTLRGHKDSVHSVKYSRDGRRIVSGSWDKTAKIWDAGTGKELKTLIGHSHWVYDACFSNDDDLIVTASGDRSIKVWDAKTGVELKTLAGHTDRVFSVDISPDVRRIVSGSADGLVKLWDVETGKELSTLGDKTHWVFSVMFSLDGKQIAVGDASHQVRIFDVDSSKQTHVFTDHGHQVICVGFSPDGNQVVSGSMDTTIKTWNIKTGKAIRTYKGHGDSVRGVEFSADGQRMVSASYDGTIKMWDATGHQEFRELNGHRLRVQSVEFSPDGRMIASGSDDRKVIIWNAITGQQTKILEGHGGWIYDVAFDTAGKRIVSGSADKLIKIWDVETGRELYTLRGHDHSVNSVEFSPDGKMVVSGSRDSTVKLWDAKSGQQLKTLNGHTGQVHCVRFDPIGERVVSAADDGLIKIWDVDSGEELKTLQGHRRSVQSINFNADGERLVSGGSDRIIRIWDVKSGQVIQNMDAHSEYICSVTFADNDNRIISASADKTVKIWDVETGEELRTLKGNADDILDMSVSSNSQRVVSACNDKSIKVWDATPNQERRILKGHTNSISMVSFDHSGHQLFSYARSNATGTTERFVWDSVAGERIEDGKWESIRPRKYVSEDQRFLAVPSGTNIYLVDRQYKNRDSVQAFIASQAEIDFQWHWQKCRSAERTKDWYAATFHSAWLLVKEPDNEEKRDQFQVCYEKLKDQFDGQNRQLENFIPQIVADALEVSRDKK